MSDPLERLTNLAALLLRTPVPLTLEQIAAEMAGQYPADPGNRRARFERDKRELREAGLAIETVVLSGEHAGATGYRIDPAGYELPDLGLTEDEAQALNLALAAVHVDQVGAADALAKLGAVPDPDLAGGGPSPLGAVPLTPALPALPALFEAHAARAAVTFTYRGERAASVRTVDPYALVSQRGVWYVIGRDHGRDELRTFRVDRVDGVPEVGERGSFTVPMGFDAAAVLPDDARRLGASAVEAEVLVDAARARLVAAQVGADAVVERRDDGSVVVRVPAGNDLAFRGWLLELGEHAVVVGPPDVRSRFVGWLEVVAAGGESSGGGSSRGGGSSGGGSSRGGGVRADGRR